MAIQMRRGEYDDFDASKMLAGELAVVVSGDPETEGGALYVATAAGSATRVAFANEVPGDATTTSDGLMSAADKAKLDGVAAGAQVNVIESVSVNGNNAVVTGKAAAVTIPEATDAASGVMGAADKAKLDGIAEGAKKVTITEGTRGSGAKVVSFSVQNPDGTFEFPPSAVKADSNGYVDITSVANGSIPNSKLATPYSLPTMSASAKGGATVGDGLAMTGDALGIADEGVEMGMLSQDVQEAIEDGGSGGKLAATAEALLGADETAQWAQRESTGSGGATVRSVQGAAEVIDGALVPVQIAGIRSTTAQGGELDSVEWTAQTLRAAGSVRDVLYADHVDVNVGVVDMGTLEWQWYEYGSAFVAAITGRLASASSSVVCAPYGEAIVISNADQIRDAANKTIICSSFNVNVFVKDTTYADATAFKAAMNGVLLHYALATPTTTPISPALPMTYKVQQGGTESIIVPDGEVSAAPVLTIAEGESAAELVMDALAAIAAPDGPTATANHAINTYLTMGGKLYKVTRAIAVGETIAAGTNVTQTTVMDELIALTQ